MATLTDSLVARAASLVPMLRTASPAAEKARRVPAESYDALSRAGIFKMTAPRAFGGVEADFQTQCDVLAEIARGCPSTSWVATIYSAMSWLVATFPDETQEEIYATGDPRIAGVFSPTGTAVPKDGGFAVNGRWPFNTGCHGATWTVLNVLVGDIPTCMIANYADLKILDDWYAAGMSATGSNTVVAENVFVPSRRALPLPDMLEARYPARHNSDNPYFNYPMAPVLTVNAGGTPIGTARGAMDAFLERLPGRGITYTTYTNKSEAPVTHLQLAEASLKIDSSAAHVRLAAAIMDEAKDGRMTLQERVKSRAHIAYSTGLAREATDILFYASGASSIQEHMAIQRYQRDIQALSNHAIMHPQTGLELYGRILCGLPPNTLLY
jgi:3-hydroxy-9,10-secoandrosta-1,3,5(10)-triene-9,17-dione monooxygenase